MCLLTLAWQADPRWPLVLAGNRDERHDRPTLTARRWQDAPHVLGGVDLEAGGAWLGVSELCRLVSVTNVRSPGGIGRARRSRGLLTRGFLLGETDLAGLRALDLDGFNPFNLIGVQDGQAFLAGNSPRPQVRLLGPGIYGLSNGSLDEPWPKTLRLKAVMAGWLAGDAAELEPLFEALADPRAAPDGDLPDTGVGLERERMLSPAFLLGEVYGTRCSTVVRIAADGQGELTERSFGPMGVAAGEVRLAFRWPVTELCTG